MQCGQGGGRGGGILDAPSKTEPEEERFHRTQPATASSVLPNGSLFMQPRGLSRLFLSAAQLGIDLPNGKSLQWWVLAALSQAFLWPLIS